MTYGIRWLNLLRACFLAAVILLTGLVETSRACSCMYAQSACEGYWPANAVFDGTVTKIESIVREERFGGRTLPSTMHLVTLEIKQSWKGVDGPVVQRTARSFSHEGAHNDRGPAEIDVRLSVLAGRRR
jgi:hypothetical protein